MKRFFTGLLIGLAVLALVWCGGRYGWRLAGFAACDGSGIRYISVTDTQVIVEGFDPGSFPRGCVGTISRQEGDTLIVGVRYSTIFGFFETGTFRAEIPVEGRINRIILRTGYDDYPIWDRAKNPTEATEGFFQ